MSFLIDKHLLPSNHQTPEGVTQNYLAAPAILLSSSKNQELGWNSTMTGNNIPVHWNNNLKTISQNAIKLYFCLHSAPIYHESI